jgi:hypothetical protein
MSGRAIPGRSAGHCQGAPDPVAALRRVRLRGRLQQDIEALHASERWRMAQQALERCSAPPDLRLA